MKKSVKILIIILFLIIVGLVTFIVVDKLILNKKSDDAYKGNEISNSTGENGELKEINESEAKKLLEDIYDGVEKDFNNDYSKIVTKFGSNGKYVTKKINNKTYQAQLDDEYMNNLKSKFTSNGFKEFLNYLNIGEENGHYYIEADIGDNDPRYISHEYKVTSYTNEKIVGKLIIKRDDEQEPIRYYDAVLINNNNKWVIDTYKNDSSKKVANTTNQKEESQNNNNSTGNEIRKKIYIGREGDPNDIVDMKLYKSSLGYEMYYSDSYFKIEKEGNKDKYIWTTNPKCGINITKIDKSISDIYNNVYDNRNNYDTVDIVEGEEKETIVTTKFDSKTKIGSSTEYVYGGDNLTYAIEIRFPQEDEFYTEPAEGILVEMRAMINTFENK